MRVLSLIERVSAVMERCIEVVASTIWELRTEKLMGDLMILLPALLLICHICLFLQSFRKRSAILPHILNFLSNLPLTLISYR
jgi:hypothetical protein